MFDATWSATLLSLMGDTVKVTCGTQSTDGVLDDDEQTVDDGTGNPVSMRTRQVTLATGAITGLSDGVTLTVGGVRYAVSGRPMPRENGDLVTVKLRKADA